MILENMQEETMSSDCDESSVDHTNKRKTQSIENVTVKKNKREGTQFVQPTVDELNQYRETQNLYNNNLFRLQLEELLTEIQIKKKRKTLLSNWLNDFKMAVQKDVEFEIRLSEIEINQKKFDKNKGTFLKNVRKYKEYNLKTDNDLIIKFKKPSFVEQFGLFDLDCLPGPKAICKINVHIPNECFQPKDYLNYRYFVKRYYYLIYIAESYIRTLSVQCNDLTIQYDENNMLIPKLCIHLSDCDKTEVHIYATPAKDTFKPTRFLPTQNNIKINLNSNIAIDPELLKNLPTVLYNSTIAHDVNLSVNWEYFRNTLMDQINIKMALKIIWIWLKQRDFTSGLGSLTDLFIVSIITHMLNKKRINRYMSSYQVLRNFFNFVSATDWKNEPLTVTGESISEEHFTIFKNSFDVIILDKTVCLNIASFQHYEFVEKIRSECKLALQILDENKTNAFECLFIMKVPYHLQFDLLIDLPDCSKDFSEIDQNVLVKYIGSESFLIADYVIKFLRKAANKRFLHIVPRIDSTSRIIFGVTLNSDEAYNFIELGPALNDYKAAADFRSFWGNLSSDRRFRDGTTRVAVYFKSKTIKARRGIVKKIIHHVFNEKLKFNYKMYYNELEEVLTNHRIVPPYPLGTNEEASLKVISLSDELGKKIRALQMTLSITGLQGISDVYSYTNVFPPIATNYEIGNTLTTVKGVNTTFKDKKLAILPKYVEPIECVLQLEHSSKWPNNLEAVIHIKSAFYLEISKLLLKTYKILSHVTPHYIDVFYEGLIFRYNLYLPKENALLKQEVNEAGVISYKTRPEAEAYEKTLNVLPTVISALKGIQSQYPSFGPGTALIKRWLRSQLIDEFHFPDTVISLLNASLYLTPNCFHTPTTPQISFWRFLKFFRDFQFEIHPVVVNFNGDLNTNDLTEIENNLQQNRTAFPALCIVMPYDNHQSIFTKSVPSKQILLRIKELATSSLIFLNELIDGKHSNELQKELFVPNWEGYNVLIHLKPLLNPRRHEQIIANDEKCSKIQLEKYNEKDSSKIPIVGFNPVQFYLKELRESYGEFASFFHDTYGGNTIGVLWNPKVFDAKDIKVSLISGRKLENNQLVFNEDSIIEDFYIIGKDVVKLIEKK